MTVPAVVVEAFLGGSWVVLTDDVRVADRVVIRRGRQNELGSADAGMLTLVLVDDQGLHTEGGPAAHPEWTKGAQVRVSVNGSARCAGRVTSLKTRWRGTVGRAVTTVTAVDAIAELAADDVLAGDAVLPLAGTGPVAWWPMDEPDGALTARDRVGTAHLNLFSGAYDPDPSPVRTGRFGVAAPEGLPWSSGVHLQPGLLGGIVTWYGGMHARPISWPAPPQWTVLMAHVPGPWIAGTVGGLGVLAATLASTPPLVHLLREDDTTLRWYLRYGTPSTAGTIPKRFAEGEPCVLGVAFDETTVRILGTGVQLTVTTAKGLHEVVGLYCGVGLASGPAPGLLGPAAVIPRALTEAEFAVVEAQLLGKSEATPMPVSQVLHHAALAAGTQADVVTLGYDRPVLYEASTSGSPASIGDRYAEAAGAMWVADRATNQPTWIDHRWVGPKVTLPGSAISLDGLDWAADRSLQVTDVTSDSKTLASSGLTPHRGRDLAPLLPPADVQHHADWLANTGALMGAPRLGGVRVNLLTTSDAGVVADVLALDLRHRLQVVDPPPQVPAQLRVATVEGYEEVVGLDEWSITLNTAPDPRGIWGDPVQGVLGAAADNRYAH